MIITENGDGSTSITSLDRTELKNLLFAAMTHTVGQAYIYEEAERQARTQAEYDSAERMKDAYKGFHKTLHMTHNEIMKIIQQRGN